MATEARKHFGAESPVPPKVVADFHLGDMASDWKPTPTLRAAGSAIPPYRKIKRAHWLPAALAFVLLPKCALCVVGYLAVTAGLGVATPELCGTVADTSPWSQGRFIMAATAVSACTFWLMIRQRARGIQEVENTKQPSS